MEIPSQVHGKLLALMVPWLVLWPLGALVVAAYLMRWIDNRWLLLPAMLLVAIVWLLPWLRFLGMMRYLLGGLETITIRPGSVEIARGAGRSIARQQYDRVDPASWRVSPSQHHVRDWQGIMSPGPPGPTTPGGALSFTYNRRAVRCGRNFGTREAGVLLREIQEFLEVNDDER